jgi:hypothetical protein
MHACTHARMHACTHACAVRRCLAFFDKMVGMNFLLSTQECDETTQFTCAQVRALLQSTGFARDDVAQVLCVWVCPREGRGGCAVLWVWVCPGVDADKQDADTVERVERLRSVPSGGQSSRFPSTLIVHVIWVLVHACM